MSNDDKIRELEQKLDHARRVALNSIGQGDRREAVELRDDIAAELIAAREAAGRYGEQER